MYRAYGCRSTGRFFLLALMCLVCGTHARAAERPNVLLILADDFNDWVGFLQGHPQTRTPNLDRLAERGVVFANAHCAAPLCCPSRAALFSGRQPFNTGVYDNDQNIRQHHPELVLLPQYFARHGYRTLGTGKLLHHASPNLYDDYFATEQRWSPLGGAKEAAYTPEELALKAVDLRHVVHYGPEKKQAVLPLNRMPSDRNPRGPAGESFDWGGFDAADGAMGDAKITSWAIEQLQRKPQDGAEQPFLLCVGYYRPHIPLWAPQKYFDLFPVQQTILPKVNETDLDDLSATGRRWALEANTAGLHKTVVEHGQWQAAVAAYLACVAFVDAQVGRLLEALEKSPHAENTIIVFASDHGWHLGEKQHWGKWTGWERATRVPLVIAPPRKATSEAKIGGRCDRPVGLIDLYPTFIQLCGLPAKADLDGHSLAPRLKDLSSETEAVITTFDRENYSVRSDRWRYLRYADGSEELYDHAADPQEWHNLASDTAQSAVLQQMRKALPKTAAASLPHKAGRGD